MSNDPLSKLQQALQPVFRLEPHRNGRYTYTIVQQLKDSLDQYDTSRKKNFKELLLSIRQALPTIEKSKVDFERLRTSVDELASFHQLPHVDWGILLSHSNVSPKFQFSALNHSLEEDDLLVWISEKSGKPLAKIDHLELTRFLIIYRERNGFSQKLNDHLKKEPDFLFNLIMQSDRNFIKITNSRLILFLTDQQLALAIVKHSHSFLNKQKEPYSQVRFLMKKLNELLSNGLSISTLLRNTEAKAILDNSIFFQIYQSDEYQKHQNEF